MSKRLPGSMQPIRYALPFFLSVLSFAMANPASAQEDSMHNTLTVTGKGSEMVATSLTQAQLGVEVQGDTAEAAQREAAKRSSAVVEFLRSRQVDKLETTGINLSPRYNYNNDQQQLVGYTATNTVSFRVPTDQAGTILDEAVKAGATRIDGVNFIAEDAAIATARQQAIREAIQDAQLQADAALNALGLSRKGVVSVQIGGAAPPPPIMYRARALQAADAAPAPTPVVGGEQEVEASVTLEISY
jgi:uncharacterized protein YggE